MSKRKELTLEQHEDFALELQRLRTVVIDVTVGEDSSKKYDCYYPKQSKETRALLRILSALDNAKDIMDNSFLEQFGGSYYDPNNGKGHTPYYGGDIAKKAIEEAKE